MTSPIVVNGQQFAPDPGAVITIGRDGCDVLVDHLLVSRRHATISADERGWVFRDATSTNGTFVDGIRVTELVLAGPLRLMLGGSQGAQLLVGPAEPAPSTATTPRVESPPPEPPYAAPPPAAPPPEPGPLESGPLEPGPRPAARFRPVVVVGVALLVVSGFLPWFTGSGISVNGWDVPLRFLLVDPAATKGPMVGPLLLLALGALLPALLMRRTPGWLLVVLASAALAPILGAVNRILTLDNGPDLGFGVVVAFAGALALLVGAWQEGRSR